MSTDRPRLSDEKALACLELVEEMDEILAASHPFGYPPEQHDSP